MCEKQICRFDHFTILFASKIRSIHSERVNGADLGEYSPYLIRLCDKKARSSFLKTWDYPPISS